MNYQFHPDAFDEHHDSVAFYQNRLPGLGADYLAEFDAVMARICRNPDIYPTIATPDIHRARLKRFSFDVIYRVTPTQITVLAVAHHRRRPAYWAGRFGK
ncbi:MAG: plasmid stabilization protein [Candidatus Accumulibacter phosphatis]|uniref:Plasmid stabilization protein n=1 Tax=Candidatus Accumulibacter phosphatis TaxID=327160 RepID=A0A6A7RWC9_9PROT|nr:plasmid stabilization protein [Candidatus Accumulibacter phosphatis]